MLKTLFAAALLAATFTLAQAGAQADPMYGHHRHHMMRHHHHHHHDMHMMRKMHRHDMHRMHRHDMRRMHGMHDGM
jgi:protein BEAN1